MRKQGLTTTAAGWSARIHAGGRLGRRTTPCSKGKFSIPVSREQKRPSDSGFQVITAKLAEIGSSLISPKNSGRKFQTHISNSGEQIPKHARQNSEDCRFPVSRNKVRSRGHRFLGTDFPILVSEFKFPPRSRIWHASHFSFLDSRCKSKDAHGLEIAQFQFLISRFTILLSGFKKALVHIPNPLASSFLISRFWFQRSPPFMGSEASTFLDSDFSILVAQIAEN